MLAFHTEERRASMLTYVVDLYAPDLRQYPDAVSIEHAMFDRTGYYALGRKDADGALLERQLDFHGGLRWRFEEYLPEDRRSHRPHRPVPCPSRPAPAARSPLNWTGIQHLFLPLASQSDRRHRLVPGGQGTGAQPRLS